MAKKVELYSGEYFGLCAVGGVVSCGATHLLVTPLDLVKCNMQANPKEFTGLFQGFKKLNSAVGLRGLYTGWGPTVWGYSIQGSFKFGLYEFFKHKFAQAVGEKNAYQYRDLVYLSASASAEMFADAGLCAFEAVKVRIQTTLDPVTLKPTFARGLMDGLPKIVSQDGVGGLFRGLVPLWLRQVPYTMMKFFGFERAVELIYKNLPMKKEDMNKFQQLLVSFAGGYAAGIFCAAVSHPADTVVSMLNKNKNASIGQILKETPASTLLTKGLGARIIMIGTLTGLQWLIYDTFKTSVGLPTTGGAKTAAPAAATPKPAAPAAKPVEAPKAAPAPVVAAKPVEAPKPAAPAAAPKPVEAPKPAALVAAPTAAKTEGKL